MEHPGEQARRDLRESGAHDRRSPILLLRKERNTSGPVRGWAEIVVVSHPHGRRLRSQENRDGVGTEGSIRASKKIFTSHFVQSRASTRELGTSVSILQRT